MQPHYSQMGVKRTTAPIPAREEIPAGANASPREPPLTEHEALLTECETSNDGDTIERHAVLFSRRDRARGMGAFHPQNRRGRREGRVLGQHPWPPCVKKCTGQEPQVWPRHTRPSLREWCYGLYVISPVTRLCCHRRLASSAKLNASLGAPGPHDFAVRDMLLVSQHAASIASRSQRP
jgi:hypothetical protein